MKPQIRITVNTTLTPYVYEQLEEALRHLFEERRIGAIIEDSITGNTTVADARLTKQEKERK